MPTVVPEAVLLIGAFFLLVTALILRGLLAGYSYSLGSIFQWMRSHLDLRVPTPLGSIHIPFGAPFGAIDKAIVGAMQAGIRDTEKYLAYTWHAAEKLLRYTTQMIDWLAGETEKGFAWLADIHIPRSTRVIVERAFPRAQLAKLIAAAVAHLRPIVVRGVKVVEHAVPQRVVRVVRMTAGALPYPPWAIHLPRRIGHLERDVRTLRKELSNPRALIGALAGAAIMANSLGLGTNWRCITRGNIGKTARALCGFPSHLLNDLLGIFADVWLLENVCVLLPFLEKGASEIGVPLVEALTVAGSGICKGTAAPGALRGASARLPAPVSGVALSLV